MYGVTPDGFMYKLREWRFNTGCALASPMTFVYGESRMQFGNMMEEKQSIYVLLWRLLKILTLLSLS